MSRLDDVGTTARIKVALMLNPRIGGMDINVNVVNGIAFLKGFVQDPDQKEIVERIAKSHGAFEVKNDIRTLSEVGEESAFVRTMKISSPEEDKIVVSRVLGAIEADGRINPYTINIEVRDGTLRLTGYQTSDSARERTGEIASRVQGVREVINAIEIRVERKAA